MNTGPSPKTSSLSKQVSHTWTRTLSPILRRLIIHYSRKLCKTILSRITSTINSTTTRRISNRERAIPRKEDHLLASMDILSKLVCLLDRASNFKIRKKVRCVKMGPWTKPQASWQGPENICKIIWIPVSRFKIKTVNITNPMVQTVNSEGTFLIWLQVLKQYLLNNNRFKRRHSTILITEFRRRALSIVPQVTWITLKKDMCHSQLANKSH